MATARGGVAPAPEEEAGWPAELKEHPRYRLERKVGEGGMGAVYKAEHRLMGRPVALKVMNRELVKDAQTIARFKQEVRTAALLAHPNIVLALDAEQVGDCHVLVMEFVEGVNLAKLVQIHGPMPIERACDVLRQAAMGLHHAHGQGMIHRDIKPQNLMLTRDGQLKILDFGLARFAHRGEAALDQATEKGITLHGEVLGTPDFVSPEQARNSRTVDARADLYSLGCTAYYLLTGQVPFPSSNAIEKLLMHCEKTTTPIERLRPDIPPALVEIVQKLMAKKPEERYQTADEAAAAFAALVDSSSPPSGQGFLDAFAPPAPQPIAPSSLIASAHASTPANEPRRPYPLLRTSLMVALGFSAALGLTFVRNRATPTQRPQDAPRPTQPSPLAESRKTAGPRVLYMLGRQGVSRSEFDTVRETLIGGGYKVAVVGLTEDPIRFADQKNLGEVKPDGLVGEVVVSEFDALLIGGAAGLDEYIGFSAKAAGLRRLIAELMQNGKPIAAIGTGTAVLSDSGVLSGKRVTGAASVRDKVVRDGAVWSGEKFVLVPSAAGHGPILTARDADSAGELGRALLQVLSPR
jgi:serine/threonine protein kinase/putative intracellular protease/amidase